MSVTNLLVLHSGASGLVPFLRPENGSPDFGVFMYILSECGSNMDDKNKLLCSLLLRAFKQHVDSCLSDEEVQRKQYMTVVKVS